MTTVNQESTKPEEFKDKEFVDGVLGQSFELIGSALHSEQVAAELSNIIRGIPGDVMKVVSVIGGPTAGKGTLVKALIKQLEEAGLRADTLATDDYCVGTREWRWTREKEDPLSLKDFALLNTHLEAIRNIDDEDEEIAVPTYDEETGLAIEAGEENYKHKVGRSDVIFVEGDFDAVEQPDLLIYVDVPAESRMQTRIARDLEKRGESDPERVATSFKSRYESQYLPYTLPAVEKANIVLQVNPVPGAWEYDIYQAEDGSSIAR